ncbi:hypothetical protein [Endozoicomonas sp. YOMI1]|uniref:hypothetical protein n=1 Tax=Endozoicomonas sp. YOMI1 TaxID=2828739 RepID=UPI0021487E11|nr:hypothetical protein [Endozoicomonas sp. YOMI1]
MQNPTLKLWLAFCALLPLGIFLLISASYKPPESLLHSQSDRLYLRWVFYCRMRDNLFLPGIMRV